MSAAQPAACPAPAPDEGWRIAWAAAAGGGGAAAMLAGAPPAAGVAVALAAAAAGLWRWGLPGLAALLPALAVLAGAGGWWAWAGWSLAAVAAAVLAVERRRCVQERELGPLRQALREGERDRERLGAQLGRFPRLLEACTELAAARDREHFAAAVLAHARALAPEAREALVFLADGAGGLRAVAGADAAGSARAADDAERYVGAVGRALLLRRGDGVRVIVPLGGGRQGGDDGRPQGVLSALLVGDPDATRVAVELIEALSGIAGMALATVELVEQARSHALRDDLTGLLGREEFRRRLDELSAHARRLGAQAALLACDMDHLKRYNDAYGHPAGDQALRAVARALSRALPEGAIACRWGGEEFCAALLAADAAAAQRAAEAVRQAVAACIPDPAHPERRVTVSIGVAVLRPGEAPAAALERADAALYQAKREGRDRVAVAP